MEDFFAAKLSASMVLSKHSTCSSSESRKVFSRERRLLGGGEGGAGEPLGLVFLRQAVHEELELILVGQNAGGQQLLHQLEHGYDVPPLSQHSVDLVLR